MNLEKIFSRKKKEFGVDPKLIADMGLGTKFFRGGVTALLTLSILGSNALFLLNNHLKNNVIPKWEKRIVNEFNPKYQPEIISSDGVNIGGFTREYFNEEREHVDKVPEVLEDILIAVEDKHFKTHSGIEPMRLAKAIFETIFGDDVQGGSTLTMQVAKMSKNDFYDKTVGRKVDDIALSFALENIKSKEEIERLYFSYVNFGHGQYGIYSACRYYFNKPRCEGLEFDEAAFLVSLVNAPSRNSKTEKDAMKYRNKAIDLTIGNRGFELVDKWEWTHFTIPRNKDMQKKYAHLDFKKLKKKPIKFAKVVSEIKYPFISEAIRMELERKIGPSVYTKGIRVYSSIDTRLQDAAEESMSIAFRENDKIVKKYPDYTKELELRDEKGQARTDTNGKPIKIRIPVRLEGAMIGENPRTCHIRFYVGGRNFKENQVGLAEEDLQPGSGVKPVGYLEALNQKILTLLSIIPDSPLIRNGLPVRNYDGKYKGSMPLWQGLQKSENVVAVHVGEAAGLSNIVQKYHMLGVDGDLKPRSRAILGEWEMSPAELAGAAASFLDGYYCERSFILYVEDSNGNIIYDNRNPKAKKVWNKEPVHDLKSMMQRVPKAGGTVRAVGETLEKEHFKGEIINPQVDRDSFGVMDKRYTPGKNKLRGAPNLACKTGTETSAQRAGLLCLISDLRSEKEYLTYVPDIFDYDELLGNLEKNDKDLWSKYNILPLLQIDHIFEDTANAKKAAANERDAKKQAEVLAGAAAAANNASNKTIESVTAASSNNHSENATGAIAVNATRTAAANATSTSPVNATGSAAIHATNSADIAEAAAPKPEKKAIDVETKNNQAKVDLENMTSLRWKEIVEKEVFSEPVAMSVYFGYPDPKDMSHCQQTSEDGSCASKVKITGGILSWRAYVEFIKRTTTPGSEFKSFNDLEKEGFAPQILENEIKPDRAAPKSRESKENNSARASVKSQSYDTGSSLIDYVKAHPDSIEDLMEMSSKIKLGRESKKIEQKDDAKKKGTLSKIMGKINKYGGQMLHKYDKKERVSRVEQMDKGFNVHYESSSIEKVAGKKQEGWHESRVEKYAASKNISDLSYLKEEGKVVAFKFKQMTDKGIINKRYVKVGDDFKSVTMIEDVIKGGPFSQSWSSKDGKATNVNAMVDMMKDVNLSRINKGFGYTVLIADVDKDEKSEFLGIEMNVTDRDLKLSDDPIYGNDGKIASGTSRGFTIEDRCVDEFARECNMKNWPVAGGQITYYPLSTKMQGGGATIDEALVEIKAKKGTDVLASWKGVVAQNDREWGTLIVNYETPKGKFSAKYDCISSNLNAGDKVNSAGMIGEIDNRGYLFFRVKKDHVKQGIGHDEAQQIFRNDLVEPLVFLPKGSETSIENAEKEIQYRIRLLDFFGSRTKNDMKKELYEKTRKKFDIMTPTKTAMLDNALGHTISNDYKNETRKFLQKGKRFC